MKSQIEKLKSLSAEIDTLIDGIKDNDGEITVIKDGIIDINKYCSAETKILWVLKEANDPDAEYDMRDGLLNRIKTDYGLTSAARPTFEPIIYTSYGILKKCDWDKIPKLDQDPSVADIIEFIGIVNVKKQPGGGTANRLKLQEAYDQHGHIIRKQIESYEPDIVIFGYTDYLLTNDLGLTREFENTWEGVKYWVKNNKLYIRAYHPAYYKKPDDRNEYCIEIMNVARMWNELKNK